VHAIKNKAVEPAKGDPALEEVHSRRCGVTGGEEGKKRRRSAKRKQNAIRQDGEGMQNTRKVGEEEETTW
jgi:hypothetical protein